MWQPLNLPSPHGPQGFAFDVLTPAVLHIYTASCPGRSRNEVKGFLFTDYYIPWTFYVLLGYS
jgi:hypothetical protein